MRDRYRGRIQVVECSDAAVGNSGDAASELLTRSHTRRRGAGRRLGWELGQRKQASTGAQAREGHGPAARERWAHSFEEPPRDPPFFLLLAEGAAPVELRSREWSRRPASPPRPPERFPPFLL